MEVSARLPQLTEGETIENPKGRIYAGIERLDEITRDEPLMEGAAESGNEIAQAKLNSMRAERKAILARYGINEELCKQEGIPSLEYLNNAKSVSRLLIRLATKELPPVQEGNIRMFRGEGPHPGETEDYTIGRWFAHDLNISSSYPIGPLGDSRIMYVDIPRTSLAEYHVNDMPEFRGASKVSEYLLPTEVVTQAKEFIRFLRADTVGDPWGRPLN